MKLILLYGPPAVGKLTVANELAKLTGYKVLHSHLTTELVESLFSRDSASFSKLIWDLRYMIIAEAARTSLNGLVFTMVYGRNREVRMAECVDIVERCGGQVHFVQLFCRRRVLLERVANADRRNFNKITSASLLEDVLDRNSSQKPFEAVTQWESLQVNTEKLNPPEAAKTIIAHYKL